MSSQPDLIGLLADSPELTLASAQIFTWGQAK